MAKCLIMEVICETNSIQSCEPKMNERTLVCNIHDYIFVGMW